MAVQTVVAEHARKMEKDVVCLSNKEIEDCITLACESTGTMEIRDRIHWRWHARLTSRAGDAMFATPSAYRFYYQRTPFGDIIRELPQTEKQGFIRLSPKVMAVFDEYERMDTIIHETCHVIHDYKYGNQGKDAAHGAKWKALMAECGISNARATFRLNRKDSALVRNKRQRIVVTCKSCGKEYEISKQRNTRVYNNGSSGWTCKCGGHIPVNYDALPASSRW